MSIKIFKINNVSFTFKLNEKKKVPLKKYELEREGYKKNFFQGVWCLTGGWKCLKKGGMTKSHRKNRGREACVPQRNYGKPYRSLVTGFTLFEYLQRMLYFYIVFINRIFLWFSTYLRLFWNFLDFSEIIKNFC